jgi:spore coat protein U-like protein
MPIRFFAALLLLLGLAGVEAKAQVCSFGITNINFGNINLGPGGTPPTSGTFTANCTGTPGKAITICPNIGDGTGASSNGSPRYLVNGTAKIPYDLLQPNGQVWGSYVWPYPARAPVLSLTLNAAGAGTLTQAIAASISGSIAAAPTGLYSSTYSAGHTLIDYGYAPGQSCNTLSSRAARPAFTVQAQNTAMCNVSVTALNFGTIAGLTTAQAASNQVAITCTNGAAYTVALNNGVNGGTGPARRFMAAPGIAQTLNYGIYKDAAHLQPWGSTTGTDTQSATGNGTAQSLTAFALLPAQGNPSPGTYQDTVVVTVNY